MSRQREAVLPQTPTRADAADGRTTTVVQQRVIAREKAAPAPVDRRARVRSERSLNHQLRTLSRPSAPEGGLSPISLGLLVLLTAGPAAAFLIRYRRPGDGIAAEKAPVTPSAGAGALSLEAELQEIVAEHKAREVLERDRAGPVG